MNTSNHAHDTVTTSGRASRINFLRRCLAVALLAAAITGAGVYLAATGLADTGPQLPNLGAPRADAICKTEPWGFLGSQRRTLCDGPTSSDGSWARERTIWVPAHQTMYSCSGRFDSYSGRSCYGGYWVDERLVSNETYTVRPDAVLPDEPGHLG